MQNTTADYKLEINKPSRSFECKITIGNNIYTNEDLVNLTLEYTQPQEGFAIGNTISQSLDLILLNRGDIIYSTSQIKVEIGLKIGSTIEYILMGIFNIDDIEKTDYTTKFTAYDNMIKFETDYFSELGDKPTLQQVVNELSSKTGVEFTGSLPAYTVSKLEVFSCREVLSYVASICGGNAVITRDGKFTIKSLSEVEKTIDGNNYFDYTREEVKYKIGQISCQVDENNILSKGSVGTDSMELGFENPWVTESILNDIYNKLKSIEYLGYSMKWQGDLSLDPYDIITVTDIKNVVRKIPILSQKISYTGGLTSEIGAKGETKNKNSFSSSGSTANKVNRAVIEQAIIKEALIEKANIKDVEAVSIRTQTLEAKTAKIEEAIIDVAYVSDLTAINANIQKLFANDATINTALINKADITELNALQGNITSLNSEIANIKTLVNGNLSSENIQAGGITSDKLTIANGFITNAMIASLDVAKINAGDISTTKFRIVSDSGKMLISDNTIQISDKNRVRVQIGKDASNDYNMYVWDSAGKLMFDATGLKADGIKNKIIRDDMISDTANIDGAKINISSLVTEINKDTNTTVIKSSKVQIDSLKQTLDVAFNNLKTQADGTKSLTESHSTTIGVMQGQITTAINNTQIVKDGQTILLKDDYNRTVAKVDSINSTIGTHTTKINELTGSITSVDTKVNSVQRDLEGTKSTVSSHSTSITDLSSKVSTQGSSISQLQTQIALKVEATDITTAINNVQIGGRNYLRNSNFEKGATDWSGSHSATLSIVPSNDAISSSCPFKEGKVAKVTQKVGQTYGFICQDSASFFDLEIGATYTFSGFIYADKTIPVSNVRVGKYDGTSSGWANSSTKEVTERGKWVSFEHTFKATNTRVIIVAGLHATSNTSNYTVYGTGFKLEKGNKATDWTPASEDIDSSIASVQTQVTITSNKVASIETNLSSITQRVSATETKVTTVTNDLNNLQIGGRNIFRYSGNFGSNVNGYWVTNGGGLIFDTSVTYNGYNTIKTTVGAGITGGWYKLEPNVEYTYSALIKCNETFTGSSSIPLHYWAGTNNTSQGKISVIKTDVTYPKANTWKLLYITFKLTSDGDSFKPFIYWGYGTRIFNIAYMKLEKGNKPTDFTVAQEDVDLAISTVDTKVTTTSNKVATIETNLNSITSRVSSTESTVTTINGNVTSLQSRMTTAEQKITPTAITTTISSVITGGTGSISTTQFVMDKNGLAIKNGALTIQNKSGTTILNSDTNGNLIITGEMRSQYGQQWVGLNAGGLTFQDSQRNEQMLRVGLAYYEANRDMNGIEFAMPQYSDFIRFSHISKADLNNGWSSSDTSYNFFELWSGTNTFGGSTRNKGMTVNAPLYIKNSLKFYSGTNHFSEINRSVSWSNASGTISNMLGVYGDNGSVLGYKSGENLTARIIVTEEAHPGTGDNIISWGNYNFNGYTFHNANIVAKSLSVSGSKNCLQKTKNYGSRLINAYETAEYYFGDLGFGEISEDGECLVYIEDIFSECVNTNVEYHVFTQTYNGTIKIIERYKTYFIVKGEPGTSFSWELKAKRIGYENNRLDTQEIEDQDGNKVELFGDGDFKVETSEDTLMDVLTFELEDLLLMEG